MDDLEKLELIEQIEEELATQRARLVRTFIPDNPEAVPFQKQINFLRDTSLSKLARCGNRAAKTFTCMRDLAWKLIRTHWYRQDYNVFNIRDRKWMDKAGTDELVLRYLKTEPQVFWLVGPTYDFVNNTMWEKYLKKMIPAWYIQDIKYTNQKNLDSITFKNGDVIKCKTYAQRDTTKMGFVVNGVYIDEMPEDVKTITELTVRTFDCDGSITLGFTALVDSKEIQEYLDNSCASGTMILHNWSIYDNPHYSEHPERLKRAISEYANMPENERNARLWGQWFLKTPDKAVFEGIEPEVVEDFEIPLHWRRGRLTDPASHVTGHAEFAEDPETGYWYCTKGLQFSWGFIVKASDIIQEIEKLKPYPSYRYFLSVYDNSEAWFGAEAKGLGYRPCILKNREAAIIATREEVASGRVKFFRVGAAKLLDQIKVYKYNKDGTGVVKKNDHILDCLMYFCREIPKAEVAPSQQLSVTKEAILGIIKQTEVGSKPALNHYRNRMIQNLQTNLPRRTLR